MIAGNVEDAAEVWSSMPDVVWTTFTTIALPLRDGRMMVRSSVMQVTES